MPDRARSHAYAFDRVRADAVTVGQLAVLGIDLAELDQAIEEGERAQALGPVLDATLWQRGTNALAEQLRFLRAVRDFRRALETFRPREESDRG